MLCNNLDLGSLLALFITSCVTFKQMYQLLWTPVASSEKKREIKESFSLLITQMNYFLDCELVKAVIRFWSAFVSSILGTLPSTCEVFNACLII